MPPKYNEFRHVLQNGRPAGEVPGGALSAVRSAQDPATGEGSVRGARIIPKPFECRWESGKTRSID